MLTLLNMQYRLCPAVWTGAESIVFRKQDSKRHFKGYRLRESYSAKSPKRQLCQPAQEVSTVRGPPYRPVSFTCLDRCVNPQENHIRPHSRKQTSISLSH